MPYFNDSNRVFISLLISKEIIKLLIHLIAPGSEININANIILWISLTSECLTLFFLPLLLTSVVYTVMNSTIYTDYNNHDPLRPLHKNYIEGIMPSLLRESVRLALTYTCTKRQEFTHTLVSLDVQVHNFLIAIPVITERTSQLSHLPL